MESCPVCGEDLGLGESDCRQEWERIEYHCDNCNNDFSRLITYKTQSHMVQSDEWEHSDEELNQMVIDWEDSFGGDSGNDADHITTRRK